MHQKLAKNLRPKAPARGRPKRTEYIPDAQAGAPGVSLVHLADQARCAATSAARSADQARRSATREPARPRTGSPRRKLSMEIELASGENIHAALTHASHLGMLPNRLITINWAQLGIEDGIRATGKLLKLIGDASRRFGKIAYVAVREVGPIVGEHVHILLHLPHVPHGWYASRIRGWMKKCGAPSGVAGARKTTPIRGAPKGPHSDPRCMELHQNNVDRLRKYLKKHGSREVYRVFGIKHRCGPCVLLGKRTSVSQVLGQSSRSRCARCNLRAALEAGKPVGT